MVSTAAEQLSSADSQVARSSATGTLARPSNSSMPPPTSPMTATATAASLARSRKVATCSRRTLTSIRAWLSPNRNASARMGLVDADARPQAGSPSGAVKQHSASAIASRLPRDRVRSAAGRALLPRGPPGAAGARPRGRPTAASPACCRAPRRVLGAGELLAVRPRRTMTSPSPLNQGVSGLPCAAAPPWRSPVSAESPGPRSRCRSSRCAHDRRLERGAGVADAGDRLLELPHHLGAPGCEVEAVGDRERLGTGATRFRAASQTARHAPGRVERRVAACSPIVMATCMSVRGTFSTAASEPGCTTVAAPT